MKGPYAYPPDEFDAAAQEERPRGVHRAPRSWGSRWGALVAVLVVFPLLAFGVVTWLSDWDGLQRGGVTAEQGQDGGAEEEPGDGVEPTEAAPEAPVEETPTEEPAPEPTPEEPVLPEPDLAADVAVLNATGTAGLAGSAAERLAEAGFTAVSPGNWQDADPDASVVYFPDPTDEGTAAAVATALGIATVEPSADVDTVTAVLWTDYVAP
nr:LytR C-terminal domain-containing protein [uncultured Actinotalea sp.]